MDFEVEDGLKAILAWWDDAGVDVPIVPETVKRRPQNPTQAASAQPVSRTPPARSTTTTQTPPPKKTEPKTSVNIAQTEALAQNAKTLEQLKTAMQGFDAGPLSDGARQCVFSRGNPEAKIMILGETPGLEEDMQGKPFVGPSGQLLDKMLAAIGLTEDDVYISNVINWRLPKNRTPKPDEIAFCRPLFTRHIELIAPKIIVMVGGQSMMALTGLEGIMKMRGQWQEIEVKSEDGLSPTPALPLYHPAFLLRQPALKKDAWRDLLSLRMRIDAL